MKKTIVILIICMIILSGCSFSEINTSASGTSSDENVLNTNIFNEEVSTLENETIDLDKVDDNIVNITNAGNYILTGSFEGQIRVEVNKEADVKLTLSGVSITNQGSACIYFVSGDKLIISTEDGTENTLCNKGAFIQSDSNNVDGAVFAKDDLQISGHGSLCISSEYGHGIVAKDDLEMKNLSAEISSFKKGISVNDTATFSSGTFIVNSGKKGICAAIIDFCGANVEINSGDDAVYATDGSDAVGQADTSVNISDGEIVISSGGDGIDSKGSIYITGGTLTIISYNAEKDTPLAYDVACDITGGVQNIP